MPGRPPSRTPPPAPRRSFWRDAWMWAALLGFVPLALHSLGAPLGEPVADDWDFVHRALFGPFELFDGGGSSAFWRPLAHQVYYRAFSGLALEQPWAIPLLHGLALAIATALVYRTARTRMGGGAAAALASFPLLCTASRSFLSWTSHSVELGLIVFSALALHEAAAGRRATALLALLAALLCKEVAVVTAAALPWLAPVPGADRRAAWRVRRGWALAAGVLTVAWALAYLAVRRARHLHLPHAMETTIETVGVPWLERYAWTLVHTARAAFSMPPAAGPLDALWGVLVLALLAAAGNAARNPAARARLRAALPAVGFGLAWFAASSVPLTFVYPMWMPHRAVFGGLGLAVALIACLAAARPLLLAALVAVWLAAFGTSPGPPAHVTMAALETGSFLDFPKLVRLQRLMRETRGALARHRPTLPPGARVGLLRPPLHAEYAYGRDLALQCWYRDTTLRLLRWEEFRGWTERRLDAVLEFDEVARPQMRWVEPEAMRLYAVAASLPERDAWQAALDTLARAEALQSDREAHGFLGRVRGLRAFCFLGLGRTEDAEAEARRSLALWPEGGDARYTLAAVLAYSGRPEEARGHLDTLLALHPGDRSGMALRDSLAR